MASNELVTSTGAKRHNFGKMRLNSYYPDLLEIQLKSFKEFFQLENNSRK